MDRSGNVFLDAAVALMTGPSMFQRHRDRLKTAEEIERDEAFGEAERAAIKAAAEERARVRLQKRYEKATEAEASRLRRVHGQLSNKTTAELIEMGFL